MSTIDVKEYIPVIPLRSTEPIILQRVYYTLVLVTAQTICKIWLLYWNYSAGLLSLYTTTFRIMEKYCAWTILVSALELVCTRWPLLLCADCCVLFAVHVYAVVELFVTHPHAFECFLAIWLYETCRNFHAFRLDELYLGAHFEHILPCGKSLFILDYRWREWFERFSRQETVSCFSRTDSDLVIFFSKQTDRGLTLVLNCSLHFCVLRLILIKLI